MVCTGVAAHILSVCSLNSSALLTLQNTPNPSDTPASGCWEGLNQINFMFWLTQLQEIAAVLFYLLTMFCLFSGHHQVFDLQLHKRNCQVKASRSHIMHRIAIDKIISPNNGTIKWLHLVKAKEYLTPFINFVAHVPCRSKKRICSVVCRCVGNKEWPGWLINAT